MILNWNRFKVDLHDLPSGPTTETLSAQMPTTEINYKVYYEIFLSLRAINN